MQDKLDLLNSAVQQWQQQSGPVSQAIDADELKKMVDVSLSDEGAPSEQISRAVKDYLQYSPNTTRPEFFKLLYSGLNQEALLGDWVASLANATMHTYQVGPVATLMELELIDQCNQLIGFEQGEGVMVAGGSQANLVGMMLARHRICPNFKQHGLQAMQGKALRAYVSDQAHYSYERAANVLGIGTENLVKVQSDEQGCMQASTLQSLIEQDIESGHQPFFIGVTAGTTVVGAFDPVKPCSDIAVAHGIWLHVDGAWGAPVLFSKTHRHLLADVQLADSLAWDAHKLMNVPITAAFILVKQQGSLQACTAGGGGDYLFHADANAEYNLGERSIQCGRRADALKVWLSWKATGNNGFEQKVDRLQTLKSHCVEQIESHSELELIGPTGFLNVLFRFNPQAEIDESALAALNKTICKEMVARGGPHVDYATYKGRTGIRLILGNQEAHIEHIKTLMSECVTLGAELFAA